MNQPSPPEPNGATQRPPRADAGFSLVELMVTFTIVTVVLIAALNLVDSGSRITRTQTDISELQNNLRVSQQEMIRMLEMTGIGGMPEGIDPSLWDNSTDGVFPDGLALAVTNDVPALTNIDGDPTSPLVVPGTDILTVRGVFSTPVYFLEPQQTLTPDGDGKVTVTIQQAPEAGVVQDLESLRQVLNEAVTDTPPRPEAFILRDRFNPGAYAVMELDPAATQPGATGDASLTVGLILGSDDTNQEYADEYGRMLLGTSLLQGSGGTQVTLPDSTSVQLPRSIGAIGLLEEYRFYVRQEWSVSGDPTTSEKPILTRTRFYPGTDDIYPDGSVDVSDGVVDLQVALGVDLPAGAGLPPDGRVADGVSAAGLAVDLELDEVLYNHPDDDDGLGDGGGGPQTLDWAVLDAQVLFARISAVVQAPRPDRDFEGKDVGTIEDHDLSMSNVNSDANRKIRKRHLQTIVMLRNLS